MFVSYAQNFEDVMLWRALKHVEDGFFIDVGAHDPVADSISRAFKSQGWHGVHVEPSKDFADALRKAYPDDVVIEALIGTKAGCSEFFEIVNTGLSTANADLAGRHAVSGRQINPRSAMVIRLATVLDAYSDREVHWLKIDVEGHEASVIESWKPSRVRPWIVVIESIDPISHEDNAHLFEPELCTLGYDLVYWDGLNRFYLSHERMELKSAFSIGPNLFDGFSLSGTASSPFCELQRQKLVEINAHATGLTALITTLETDKHAATSEIERLTAQHASREAELAAQAEANLQEIARLGALITTLETDKHAATSEIERLAAQHASREAELAAQAEANLQEIARLHRVVFEQSAWGEASVRHVNQLTHQISSLRKSTSWRLTKPLRGVGYVLKGGLTVIRRAPGGVVRGIARAVRGRAPRLYFKLATTRSVRRIYEPFSRPIRVAPVPTPSPDMSAPTRVTHAPIPRLTEFGTGTRSVTAAAIVSAERAELHPAPVEAALLTVLAKTSPGRRIHA